MKSGFINREISLVLDLARALAAFTVLLGHAIQRRIYTGETGIGVEVQHYAVVVFFVLSGLVIASSTMQRQSTLADYAIDRATRIVPVALLGILAGLASYAVWLWFGTAPIYQPPAYASVSAASLLLPVIFMSECNGCSGPVWNPPFWSLCYEVWYYALFAAAFFMTGARRAVWLTLMSFCAGLRILILLPVWLIGVILARCGERAAGRLSPALSIALIVAAAFAFWGLDSLTWPLAHWLEKHAADYGIGLKFSGAAITDFGMGLCAAAALIGLRGISHLLTRPLAALERPIRAAAASSFTLYLLHWPLLNVLLTFHLTTGSAFGFAAILAAICALCVVIAALVESRRYALRAALHRQFARMRSGATPALT